MSERTLKIKFLAQGEVEQSVKLNLDCEIPVNEIEDMLNGGTSFDGDTALTTISFGGNLILQDDDGNSTVIGTVVDVDPELVYTDFEVEESK